MTTNPTVCPGPGPALSLLGKIRTVKERIIRLREYSELAFCVEDLAFIVEEMILAGQPRQPCAAVVSGEDFPP